MLRFGLCHSLSTTAYCGALQRLGQHLWISGGVHRRHVYQNKRRRTAYPPSTAYKVSTLRRRERRATLSIQNHGNGFVSNHFALGIGLGSVGKTGYINRPNRLNSLISCLGTLSSSKRCQSRTMCSIVSPSHPSRARPTRPWSCRTRTSPPRCTTPTSCGPSESQIRPCESCRDR